MSAATKQAVKHFNRLCIRWIQKDANFRRSYAFPLPITREKAIGHCTIKPGLENGHFEDR